MSGVIKCYGNFMVTSEDDGFNFKLRLSNMLYLI